MSEYTIDVNGKRYSLNEDFREALQRRAEREYDENPEFSCWWKTDDDEPVLVIETTGVMVPWDRMDQLEMHMGRPPEDETEDVDFGRTHFGMTPHRYDEVPSPGGDDPEKIPPKPERLDEPMMVMWVPSHPDVDVTWSAGEAMTSMFNWVEWNVQEKADQPRPAKGKRNSHDAFQSLCQIHDCEVVGEYTPSNNIPQETSGQVERKGEEAYTEGKYGGGNWGM